MWPGGLDEPDAHSGICASTAGATDWRPFLPFGSGPYPWRQQKKAKLPSEVMGVLAIIGLGGIDAASPRLLFAHGGLTIGAGPGWARLPGTLVRAPVAHRERQAQLANECPRRRLGAAGAGRRHVQESTGAGGGGWTLRFSGVTLSSAVLHETTTGQVVQPTVQRLPSIFLHR